MAAKTVIAMDEEQTICREVLKQCMVDMMKLSTEDADCFLDICLTECETKEEKIRCAAFLWDLYMFSLRTQKGFMFDETVKWIDEYYSKEEFEQLESDEVFETFHRLDIKNAKKLFLRMGCKTTIVDGLCKSLRENDPNGFVRELDKCDISKIAPYLDYFHNQIELLQLSSNEDKSEEEVGEEYEQYVINWKARAETTGDKIMLDTLQLGSIYDDESLTEEQKSAFLSYYYCCLLHLRAVLESDNVVTKKEKKVLHFILDIPDCVDLQNRFNDIWTSKISGDEFLEAFECCPKIREHYIEHYGLHPEIAESDQQAQMEVPEPTSTFTPEPDQETITVDPNLTDRDYETFAYPLLQKKQKGRHRGKWYNTKYYVAAEDELGDSIKRDVWPLIRKRLGEFEYPDSVAGESKRIIVKNLGAALIYYAAQGTNPPIAKDWIPGVKSSYKRTFERFEDVARNSIDPFMTMLELYEEVEPLLESDQKNKAASKLLVLLKNYRDEQKKYILSHNLYEIKDLIEYLRGRLPAIFKPYFKDK